MYLVIDIGNTQVKAAVFKGNALIKYYQSPKENFETEIFKLIEEHSVSEGMISHVSQISQTAFKQLQDKLPFYILNDQTPLPFKNKYLTPKTLGVDRLALVAGAVNKYPGHNALVIDAGSCITYDFVNMDREYHGGMISPGIEMRYKAVHQFTANLPLLKPEHKIPPNGNSTANAIHRGILNGVIQEIEGVISQYKGQNQKLTVVLTGGDTIFLAKNLKSSIFANPKFLLEGLNSILIHNLSE